MDEILIIQINQKKHLPELKKIIINILCIPLGYCIIFYVPIFFSIPKNALKHIFFNSIFYVLIVAYIYIIIIIIFPI